jgi:hypothetical protein
VNITYKGGNIVLVAPIIDVNAKIKEIPAASSGVF